MSASTAPTFEVLGEEKLSGSINSVRNAVADVEQWLEGEDALSALVRNVVLQLEAVRRTQLLQEQEIHGRNKELHELHSMLQSLLSDGQAQSTKIVDLQAQLKGHHQLLEGECTDSKMMGIAGAQLMANSTEHLTEATESIVQRLNLLDQRLVCLEDTVAEYHETHKSAVMQASRCKCDQYNWATDIRKSLESLVEDVGQRLDDLDSGMTQQSKQLDALQAAHTTLVEEASERVPCHTEVMSHFALFVKKEDACMHQAALNDRITRLERATVGSLQGTSLNFHPGTTGTSTVARGRSIAAERITRAAGEQERQKIRPEPLAGMEQDRNERSPGPETRWTSTSVERNHSSSAAGAVALGQSPRPAEPVACRTQPEWHPCSIVSPTCSVGAPAGMRSLSSTAIERRRTAATSVGAVIAAHGVTPAVTSNYVLLQRNTVQAPPMPVTPVTGREPRTALVIRSPSASPPQPGMADRLFSKIETNARLV